MKILYCGRANFPEGDAAANRILGNCYCLNSNGHKVKVFGYSNNKKFLFKNIEFNCIKRPKNIFEKLCFYYSAKKEISLLKSEHFDAVILYDYCAFSMKKILKFCRKNNIKCYGDITEFYYSKSKNIVKKCLANYEMNIRINKLYPKCDGLIVISDALFNLFTIRNKILVPPLVDIKDKIWQPLERPQSKNTSFVYAGCPGKTKDCLDVLVRETQFINKDITVKIVGLSKQDFINKYNFVGNTDNVEFYGWVDKKTVIKIVMNSDYSILLRNKNMKTDFGFPSKIVESISCGVPFISTNISDIRKYADSCGLIINLDNIGQGIEKAIELKSKWNINRTIFDFRNYSKEFEKLFGCIIK